MKAINSQQTKTMNKLIVIFAIAALIASASAWACNTVDANNCEMCAENGVDCVLCKTGYFLNHNSCVNCTVIDSDCIVCSDGKCTVCTDAKHPSPDGKTCVY